LEYLAVFTQETRADHLPARPELLDQRPGYGDESASLLAALTEAEATV
jgi:hypothetical protein